MKTKLSLSMFFIFVVLLILPSHSMAHTHLETSIPEDGETLDTLVEEIILEFDGGIEPFANIEVIGDTGEEVELADIHVEQTRIVIVPSSPLASGIYSVDWSIISEDTHQMEGTFSFTVTADEVVEEEITEVVEEVKEEGDTPSENETEESINESSSDSSAPSFPWPVVFIIVAVIIGIFIIIVMMNKKK
ncbi:copper resistance protein CopC [Alkalihalobacillus sp. 1P02AB]|uniref:copper resistance CopC family protein n=1 Tax=Alkalihalobacillus sp. 1P02AB TaxID=3132260 RepID=UPI0039A52D55